MGIFDFFRSKNKTPENNAGTLTINSDSGQSPFVICYRDSSGVLLPIEENPGRLKMLSFRYGRKLYDFLVDDHNLIRFENNQLVLKELLLIDAKTTLMNVVGRIAESVVVDRCGRDAEINHKLMRIASGIQLRSTTSANYKAVGTGFATTKRLYPDIYDPQDMQRDIMWLDNVKNKPHISKSGKKTGLQIKASKYGRLYGSESLIKHEYEVPLLYFDLNGDYRDCYMKLKTEWDKRGKDSRDLDMMFVRARDIDADGYEELRQYCELLEAMIQGKMKPEQLIYRAERESATFATGLMAGTMEKLNSGILIGNYS